MMWDDYDVIGIYCILVLLTFYAMYELYCYLDRKRRQRMLRVKFRFCREVGFRARK